MEGISRGNVVRKDCRLLSEHEFKRAPCFGDIDDPSTPFTPHKFNATQLLYVQVNNVRNKSKYVTAVINIH